MDKTQVRKLALESGFKLKEQGDGSMDLNPYVYDFVSSLFTDAAKHNTAMVRKLGYSKWGSGHVIQDLQSRAYGHTEEK